MVSGYDSAKEIENTWNSRLVKALQAEGFPSARFEPQYHVFVRGKKTERKPDIDFKDGGTHIISGKFGEANELAAFRSATEYSVDLKSVVDDLGEVFAVVYPGKKGEKFRLHVLPSSGRPGEVPFACDTLGELAKRVAKVVEGRIAELTREPLTEEAPRLILNGAAQLAESLKGIPDKDLEQIFGGHDFFVSVLQHKLKKKEKRSEALRMGASYLFTNQLFFYVLLSRTAELEGKPDKYPPISVEHAGSPNKIRSLYFERVRDVNYEPIYGFDVAQYFRGEGASEACRNLLTALKAFAPNLDASDLVGQVFQSLIPFEIRKPLGAHFTNYRAAKLLARLAIKDSRTTVLDPACGSGTLLVASYQRKKELADTTDQEQMHKRFLENEITGMDAMAFSAHLAVVNLASQQPLVKTEHVRIATTDSTIRKPGDSIPGAQEALPHEFLQADLSSDFEAKTPKKSRGAVRSSRGKEPLIELGDVDLVIMNPPFTSWDNMGKIYRDNLKKRFSNERPAYRKALFWKISQQAFFFLLADRFLKPGGTVAAVAPLTTFTGRAFHELVDWFAKNYTIQYIIVGMKRCSFSEDTSLTECLVVARKVPPVRGHTFKIVGTLKNPDEWTEDDIHDMASAIESGRDLPDLLAMQKAEQQELLPSERTLTDLYLSLLPGYGIARVSIDSALESSACAISTMNQVYSTRELEVSRWVLGSEHLPYYGAEALLACRNEERAIKKEDRLVVREWLKNKVRLVDRNAPHYIHELAASDVKPALRRFSLLPTIDVTSETDLCIVKSSQAMHVIMQTIYGKNDAKKYLKRIDETSGKWKGGKWASRVEEGSSQVCIARRMDFSASGTTLLAAWSDDPMFLAGDGYFVRGLKDRREGRFLVMWLNSTIALHRLLGRITITRGTWAKVEEFMLKKLPIPAYWNLDAAGWRLVDEVWQKIHLVRLPCLMEQLEQDHIVRHSIDRLMLQLIGVPEEKRLSVSVELREGVLDALKMLHQTMSKEVSSESSDDMEEMDEDPGES